MPDMPADMGDHIAYDDRQIVDFDSGVVYTPLVMPDGRVGYEVESDAGERTFIYFNPSDGSDNGAPNVFVYMGARNDPVLDAPLNFYDIDFES
jgi:hypothetical protein